MYIQEANNDEKLYSLDVQGVEDRGENDPLKMLIGFKESIRRGENGRYEVSVPYILGNSLSSTSEQPCRRCLIRVEKKSSQNPKLKGRVPENSVRSTRGRYSGGCIRNAHCRLHLLHATQRESISAETHVTRQRGGTQKFQTS